MGQRTVWLELLELFELGERKRKERLELLELFELGERKRKERLELLELYELGERKRQERQHTAARKVARNKRVRDFPMTPPKRRHPPPIWNQTELGWCR